MGDEEKTSEIKQINNLHVYALLTTEKSNGFDLQLITANEEKKFVFKCIAKLEKENSDGNSLPYLYYLELQNQTDGQIQPITSYSLRISAPGTFSSWHYQESKELKERGWFNENEVDHQFLFSVDFQSGLFKGKPPCHNVCNWDQLWQYTYFIIRQNKLTVYDLFIDQFSTKRIDFEQNPDLDNFFRQCFTFLPTIRKALDDDVYVNIILVRMIGLLCTGQISLQKPQSISFIDIILGSILNKIEPFFNFNNEDWWLLVKVGLTNLLYLKFQLYDKSQNNDSITFINMIPHTNQYQQQVADSVAKKITSSNIKPTQPNWLDLFNMTTDDTLIIDCLQLANTFTEYINYAERLLNSKQIPNIKEQISDKLRIMIGKSHFQLTLENIQLLFKTLQTTCTDDVRNVLEQSQELSSCITNYLNRLPITNINQLDLIYQILNGYYNPFLLQNFPKMSFITSTLTKHKFMTSTDLLAFYIKWFNCFLCDPHHTNSNEETENFRYYINNWLNQITSSLRIYVELIKLLDDLISMLEKSEDRKQNSSRLDTFFEVILINYTTAEPNLIKRVNDVEIFVKNKKFLAAFKLHFKTNIVRTSQCTMKTMDIYSPLYQLWQNTKKTPNSKLTIELMEICTDAVELEESEIYTAALINPNEKSFLSVILLDPYFREFKIHQTAVNGLKEILKEKEENGIQLKDLNSDRNFTRNQKKQFVKIWQYVQKFCGQQPSMEILLNTAHKELEEKSMVKEKVQTCLTTYCENANDIQQYQSAIDQITAQLTNNYIKSIQIPDDVSKLVQFADVLNPYNTSKTWLNFWQNNRDTSKLD